MPCRSNTVKLGTAARSTFIRKPKGTTVWVVTRPGRNFAELSIGDHVHDFDVGEQNSCAAKDLESKHLPLDLFDGPVVLLDDVVQVL
jgi:hypothetical protein